MSQIIENLHFVDISNTFLAYTFLKLFYFFDLQKSKICVLFHQIWNILCVLNVL